MRHSPMPDRLALIGNQVAGSNANANILIGRQFLGVRWAVESPPPSEVRSKVASTSKLSRGFASQKRPSTSYDHPACRMLAVLVARRSDLKSYV